MHPMYDASDTNAASNHSCSQVVRQEISLKINTIAMWVSKLINCQGCRELYKFYYVNIVDTNNTINYEILHLL